MTASAFIDCLESRGVVLTLAAGVISVKSPVGALSDRMRQGLVENRRALTHELFKRLASRQFPGIKTGAQSHQVTPWPSIQEKLGVAS